MTHERSHHGNPEGIKVLDFPVLPVNEPLAAANVYTQASVPAGQTQLVIARYDMPDNFEGLLHYTLLAVTNSGQAGPNPGMAAQLIACAGGTQGTPKGSPTILSQQESSSPLVTLSDQAGVNLPVLSGGNAPALVAQNVFIPSTRRLIAIVALSAGAPSAYLLWGRLWGYRWPVGSLSEQQKLQLLLTSTATQW